MSPSRRIKIAYLLADDIVQAFFYEGTGFPLATGPGAVNELRRLRLDGVPLDATFRHPFDDLCRDCIGLVVEHPSFDEVPAGEVPPTVAVKTVHLLTDEAGRPVERRTTWCVTSRRSPAAG